MVRGIACDRDKVVAQLAALKAGGLWLEWLQAIRTLAVIVVARLPAITDCVLVVWQGQVWIKLVGILTRPRLLLTYLLTYSLLTFFTVCLVCSVYIVSLIRTVTRRLPDGIRTVSRRSADGFKTASRRSPDGVM